MNEGRTVNQHQLVVGFRQQDEIRHAESMDPPLLKRLLEAARYRAVQSGIVLAHSPCRGVLLPIGGPVRAESNGGAAETYFADGFCIRILGDGAVYERELALSAIQPWAAARASALAAAGVLEEGQLFDVLVAVSSAQGDGGGFERVLPPLRLEPAGDYEPLRQDELVADPFLASAEREHHVSVRMPAHLLGESIAHCRAEPDEERAGVFVGHLRQDACGIPYVQVQRFFDARHTRAEAATVLFTRETWEDINKRMIAFDPDVGVVAWIHSHPSGAVDMVGSSTALFMSPQDVGIMSAHFDAYFHTALVVDPALNRRPADCCGVFGWDRSGAWLERRSIDLQLSQGPTGQSSVGADLSSETTNQDD